MNSVSLFHPNETGPGQPADETIQLTGEFSEVPKLDDQVQQEQGNTLEAAFSLPWNPDVARAITQSALNIPAVIYGEHLIRTPSQVEPVVMPLYELGKKYGLNTFPWMTELAFICAVGVIAGGIYHDHTEYMKTHTEEKQDTQSQASREQPQEKKTEATNAFEAAVSKI